MGWRDWAGVPNVRVPHGHVFDVCPWVAFLSLCGFEHRLGQLKGDGQRDDGQRDDGMHGAALGED